MLSIATGHVPSLRNCFILIFCYWLIYNQLNFYQYKILTKKTTKQHLNMRGNIFTLNNLVRSLI
jgi:hypothetical protein